MRTEILSGFLISSLCAFVLTRACNASVSAALQPDQRAAIVCRNSFAFPHKFFMACLRY